MEGVVSRQHRGSSNAWGRMLAVVWQQYSQGGSLGLAKAIEGACAVQHGGMQGGGKQCVCCAAVLLLVLMLPMCSFCGGHACTAPAWEVVWYLV